MMIFRTILCKSRLRRSASALLSAALLGIGLMGDVALAVDDPSELLPNPAQEKRAEAIGSHLRCLVCQNESIEDSSAPLARDLRKVVREQVASGKSDPQIMAWMTARYGEFIRLAPVFSWSTALLWLMPALALVVGLAIAWRTARRHVVTPTPLSDDERARLDALSGRE